MKKINSQEILLITILTLMVTILWIYLSVHKITQNPNNILTPEETQSFSPKIDSSIFDLLKKRNGNE